MTASPPHLRPAWRGTALNIAWRAAIAIALITFIALHLNLARAGAALRHIAPGYAVAAALVMVLVGLVAAAKWFVLLRALGIGVSVAEIVRLTYIAVTWNLALPGGESGNLVKAALLARQQKSAAGAVWASLLVDQVSLAVAQLIVGILTLLLARYPPPHLAVWLGTAGVILVSILLLYALFLLPLHTQRVDAAVAALSRWLTVGAREWLAPLWHGLTRYRGHLGALAGAVGLAGLYYATMFSAYWLAARGLGLPFGYPDIAWLLALAGIATLLPITVAGVGVREGIIVYFLQERGVAPTTALAFSFAVLALQIVLGLPGIVAHFIRATPAATPQ